MVKNKKSNKYKSKYNNDIQHWTVPLLQGLTFWLGYKEQLFPNYPLTEGAIVGEAVQLINGHLFNNIEKLKYEIMYKTLGVEHSGNIRADLVICEKSKLKTESDRVKIVIEVKKNVNKKLIQEDFVRLLKLKNLDKGNKIRCFLLLVSQGEKPQFYVTNLGKGYNKELYIDIDGKVHKKIDSVTLKNRNHKIDSVSKYIKIRVRFVRKASKYLVKDKPAHYACLIEVLSNKGKK